MNPFTLHSKGFEYEATFFPAQGMNLASFKRRGVEVIDPSTAKEFENRYSGLGPLIGPHFHRRKKILLPEIKDEALFPHIEYCKKNGIEDPFSHGIARYVPWKAEFTPHSVRAYLSGKDVWKGIPLAKLEGQDFSMKMDANLTENGLSLFLSIVSDTDSLVGLHYYYRLPPGFNVIKSSVQKMAYIEGALRPIPSEWGLKDHFLHFDLNRFADYTFFPAPDPLKGEIFLETSEYTLKTTYQCICQENGWQLYRPENQQYVCIEPLSAQDPRHPNLSVSSLSINLQIELPHGTKTL